MDIIVTTPKSQMANAAQEAADCIEHGAAAKPNRRRKAGGKGKALEALVMASQGEVIVTKVPSATQWLPGGKLVPKAGPCDFVGLHLPTKRMIIFDAKECSLVTRFPVGNRDHVKPHQIAELIRYGKAGAVAGLLVERVQARQLYWLPWRILVNAPPSYKWDEMPSIGSSALAIQWGKVMELI